MDEVKEAIFHTFVMKAIFLYKRVRPGVEPVVSFQSTRTSNMNKSYWLRSIHMLNLLKGASRLLYIFEITIRTYQELRYR